MEINKKIVIPVLAVVLFSGTFLGFKIVSNMSRSTSSLTDRVSNNEPTSSNQEEDNESESRNKESIAAELGTKNVKFYSSNLKLDDFPKIFDYYIPSDMSYILNEYHKANLKSETTLPFSSWSEEAIDNTFMAKTGGQIYDLFLLKVSGETIKYGFVPINQSLIDSGKMMKIMEKYTYE